MTLKIYIIILAAMSLIAFAFYVTDKVKAQAMRWRIPEKVLLGLSFFGGAVGGYLAMHVVRHKTKKWYFHFVNIVGLIWQAVVLVYLIGNPNLF